MNLADPPTLVIGGFSSSCGVCGKGADLHEKAHKTVLGYSVPADVEGCGVEWTHVLSEYMGGGAEERVRDMRPDLVFREWEA